MKTNSRFDFAAVLRRHLAVWLLSLVCLPGWGFAQTNLVLTFGSPATNDYPHAPFSGVLDFTPPGMTFDVTVTSGTNIVPQGNVSYVATDTNVTVTLTPLAHRTGTVRVEVTGTVGSWTSTVPFEVFFRPCLPVVLTPAFSTPATNSAPGVTFTGQVAFSPTDTVFEVTITSGNDIIKSNGVSLVNATNALVSLTPKGNKSGWVSVDLKGSTSCATNTFSFDVFFSRHPPTIASIPNRTMLEDGTTNVTVTIADPDTELDDLVLTAVSGNTTLIDGTGLVFGPVSSNRTLTLTPKANENGSATITVSVSDGYATNSRSFTLTVTAVADRSTISGAANASFADTVVLTNVFAGVTIGDVDHLRPSSETLQLSVTLNSSEFATFANGGITFTTSSIPSNVTAAIRGLGVHPLPFRGLPGSVNTVTATIIAKGQTDLLSVTNTVLLFIEVLNSPPSFLTHVSPTSILEGQSVQPFFIDYIADSDLGDEEFTLRVSLADASQAGLGSLSSTNPINDNVGGLMTRIRNLVFQSTAGVMTSASVQVAFRIELSDGYGGSSVITNTLTVNQVQNPPSISGIPLGVIDKNDGSASFKPLPSVFIQDPDMGGNQPVSATLSLSVPELGTLSDVYFPLQLPSQLSGALQGVTFKPSPGAMPVGSTATTLLRVIVTDSSGLSVTNNNLTIRITSVNNAPQILHIPAPVDQPVLIPPLAPVRPFVALGLTNDDTNLVVFTITTDLPAKGALSNLGGFNVVTSGVYQMTGTIPAILASFTNLAYVLNGDYLFPPDDPGGTTFTLSARDYALLTQTVTLYIQVQAEPRNHLVVRALNDGLPGSLAYALANAGNNDVITFALPAYPATIRMPGADPLSLFRNLTLKGPGANLLTISGDNNGDNIPDRQLFRIAARVTIEGVTFSHGTAAFGGAMVVLPDGDLTLRRCAVVDCVAEQYGGAIDVDGGKLTLDGCFIGRNRLSEDTGMSGAGVSVYSDEEMRFVNTTFADNVQANESGDGGGALVVQNLTPATTMNAHIIHCTFTGNVDVSGRASAVLSVGFGTRVRPASSIFADFSGRNLNVAVTGEFMSNGGNLCDDSTRVTLTQQGQSEEVYLLDHLTDLILTDPRLGPMNVAGDPTPYYEPLGGSPAINQGLGSTITVDQRGVLRQGVPDAGAIEAGALQRLVINEIGFDDASVNFIELYVRGDSTPIDLAPYSLFVNGIKVHQFADGTIIGTNALFAADAPAGTVVNPGFGMVLAFTNTAIGITSGNNPTPVVRPSLTNAALDLDVRGTITIGQGGAQEPIGRQTWLGVYLDPVTGSNVLNTAANSVSLAPQFRGFALVPHSFILNGPFSGVDTSVSPSSNPDSPGATADGTPFGQDNAEPLAVRDTVSVTEDAVSSLALLGNDFDGNGNDRLVIVDVSTVSEPGTGDVAVAASSLGAILMVNPGATPLRGDSIVYDPRTAPLLQRLPVGVETIDAFHYEIIDIGSAPVEDYSDAGTGTVVSASHHRLTTGDEITIEGASVAAYNGTFAITVLDDNTFTIPAVFDGPASPLGRWETLLPRLPTARSEAAVSVRVIGINDPPVAMADVISNVTEAMTLRVMVRPELAGTPVAIPGDPVPPPTMSAQNVISNDLDIDTDDTWETLRVVGVLDTVHAITGYSGMTGATPVTVQAPAHGLSSGDEVLIANYGGHPSYNGYHTVTVIDADTFTIQRHYVDNHPVKGAWVVLNDANRYSATTPVNAGVTLTLRANAQDDHLLYRASLSEFLNGLAEGELYTDRFWYAVRDTHGAIGLGEVTVVVTGLNDRPAALPDPASLDVLAPLVTPSNTLGDVLSGGLDLLYVVPPSTGATGRMDLHVRDLSDQLPGTLVLEGMFVTDEDTPLDIAHADLLGNDTDIDRLDVLGVVSVDALSREQSALTLATGRITYDPTASGSLQALARGEMRIDSFSIVVSDGMTDGVVTSLVAVLVIGNNDKPTAYPDMRTTHEDEVFMFDSRTNDIEIDIDGQVPDDRLSIVAASDVPNPGQARVDFTRTNIMHDATVSELLNQLADWQVFTNEFDYTVMDNSFLCAVDDEFHLRAGTTNRLLDVLANDRDFTDAEGALEIVDAGPTLQGGLVAIVSNGHWLAYSAPAGFVGVDYFRYTIRNNRGDVSRARVMVRSVDPPFNGILHAANDHYTVAAGQTVTMAVTANDGLLPSGGSGLTVTALLASSEPGQPVQVGNAFVFSATNGLIPLTFSYAVSAGGSSTARADVVVSIVERRGTLDVGDDMCSVLPGSFDNALDVLANDGWVTQSRAALRIAELMDPAAHGVISVNASGTGLLYTPEPGFIGVESIRYVATDQIGGTGTGVVSIVVGRVRTVGDFYKLEAANPLPVALDVLANDRTLPSARGTLTLVSVSPSTATAIGTLSINGPGTQLRFAASGATGQLDFAYAVADASVPGRTATGTVSIVTVAAGTYANPDRYRVRGGGSGYILDVLTNDLSFPKLTQSYSIVGIGTGPNAPNAGGTVGIENNRLVYTPANGFFGEESFTYTMSDAFATDVAQVTVTVAPGELYANDDHHAVFYEWDAAAGRARTFSLPVTLNDRILPPMDQVFEIVGLGAGSEGPDHGGTVTIADDRQTLLYRPGVVPAPEFVETFTYEIADGSDRRASGVVRVRVRSRTNDLVALTQDDAFTVARNSVSNALPVLANDFALPGTAVGWTITSVSGSLFGGTIGTNGSAVRYTPPPGFVGVDRFSYTVSDGLGGTGGAEVSVRVGDLPTLPSHFVALAGSVDNSFDVLGNDVLDESYAGEYVLDSVFGATADATVSVSGSNTVLYTPDPARTGTCPYREAFAYTVLDDAGIAVTGIAHVIVHDPESGRSTARIALVVEGRNDRPEIHNAPSNTPITDKETALPFTGVTIVEVDQQLMEPIDVMVSIDDAAKGNLSCLGDFAAMGGGQYSLSNVTAAAATLALRQLVYVPVENRITVPTTETVGFAITVTDNKSAPVTDTQTVIAVTAVNDPPVIAGTLANQPFYYLVPVKPFSAVAITEVDDLAHQPLTVTITILEPSHGVLSNLASFVAMTTGVYRTVGITAAEVTEQLRRLAFSIGTNSVAPGGSLTTQFLLSVEDGFAPPVVDSATSVIALNGYESTVRPESPSLQGAFGLSVATIADFSVVGAPNAASNGVDAGAAIIYRHTPASSNLWTEWRRLQPASVDAGDRFGRSVAMTESRIAVGAISDEVGGIEVGTVYLYERDMGGSNNWGEVIRIAPTNVTGRVRFGLSVCLDGDVLAVGAPDADLAGGGSSNGAVFLFGRDVGGPGAWGEILRLAPTNAGSAGADFGWSVSLQGDTLVVGAPEYDANASPAVREGAVYHFSRDAGGPDAWGLVQMLTASETALSRTFGWSVDVNGSLLAVGAPLMQTGSVSEAGRVYLYEAAAGSNAFGYLNQLDRRNDAERRFGYSVSLDQGLLLVGAPHNGSLPNLGAAYLFRRAGEGLPAWTLVEKMRRPAGSTAELYGTSVDLRRGAAIVGAPASGSPASDRGSAFLYRFRHNTPPVLLQAVPDQEGAVGEPFSFAIPPGTFYDPDVDEVLHLGVTFPGGSNGLTLVSNLLSGVPATAGETWVLLTATDALGAQTSALFRVVVWSVREVWHARYFPAACTDAGLEATVWGGDGDPDNDGRVNDQEYAFGGDPTVADDGGTLLIEVDASHQVMVSYTRRVNDSDLTYTLFGSPDLAAWDDIDDWIVDELSMPVGVEYERVTLTLPGSFGSYFFRVGVQW